MIEDQSKIPGRFDRIGIWLAGICAVHCVLTIVVVSALGLGGHFLLTPEIHRLGLLLALVVAALSLGWGALKHRHATPLSVALVGLAFMAGALFVPHGPGEALLTLLGVALVSIGHLLNMRRCDLAH